MSGYYFFNPYEIQTKGIDKPYEEQIDILRKEIETADAILIGAGAGLSTAAGLTYSGERFDKYFFDLIIQFFMMSCRFPYKQIFICISFNFCSI